MSHPVARPRKRSLSPHQKQMRFFTGLALVSCALLTVGLFLLINRTSFGGR